MINIHIKGELFFSLQHIFLLLTQLILGIFLDASASLQFFFSPALIIKLLSTFTSNVYLFFFIFFYDTEKYLLLQVETKQVFLHAALGVLLQK